jgi:cell division septal protein FtsQ
MKNWKLIVLFAAVTVFAFSSIVVSGLWKDKSTIRDVRINGNITLSKEEIFEFARLNDSMICSNTLSLEMIEARIAKHPNIRKVVVSRDAGIVKIDISEKNPFAAATNSKELFLVDDQLSLYSMKREQMNIDLPVISGLSEELNTGTYGKDDLKLLKIAQYIISQSVKLNKSLYNFISEISFTDSSGITLITSDDATPVYFVEYSSLLGKHKYESVTALKDINNRRLREAIDTKLIQLDGFLKQVRIYRPVNSFKYIDMRYDDMIVLKNNYQPAEQ